MKRKIIVLVCCISIAVLTAACGSKDETDGAVKYETISAKEAHEMMKNDKEAVILDVRTEEEYKEGHIAGAVLMPESSMDKGRLEKYDKKTKFLVYCRSGNRSASASAKMAALGYEKVYDFGGINDWSYGTVKGR